ncbi:MAG: hypothetical protein OWS03_09015 [Alicyclobacillaceae bacterium]|nr:hypothetical protein [Alicyclobacillaceae bacterium]
MDHTWVWMIEALSDADFVYRTNFLDITLNDVWFLKIEESHTNAVGA